MRCPNCYLGKLKLWPFQPSIGWRRLYGCVEPGRGVPGGWATYDTGCGWTGEKREARAILRAKRKAGVFV